ncbi:MAG: hypothetical protein KGI71_06350 [Patescibacteria group bacterium]|nr:hypothetical protein [Patescibacteria group bacterium]
MELQVGTTGAKRAAFQSHDPRPLLREIMDNHENTLQSQVTRDKVIDIFTDQILHTAKRRYLRQLIKWWATNAYNAALQSPMDKTEQQKLNEKYIEHAKTMVAIKWFDWIMPNNKPLSDCTGNELQGMRRLIGRNFKKLTTKIAPDQQVKDVFNREELQGFFS